MPTLHQAVLVEETMHVLDVKSGGRYLDATLGGGTHSEQLLRRSSPDGKVWSLDVDSQALQRARQRLSVFGDRWRGIEANFRHLARVAEEEKTGMFDGILLDLGFSSDELVDRAKGLSFLEDGPLDMRFGPKANEDGLTAADIVNSWSEQDLEKMIRNYGEDRFARRIAAGIVKARKVARIIGTFDLVTVIRSSVPASYERGRIHPATRTFQALRIAVNDELEALKQAIEGSRKLLLQGGRLAIISFHSLEDRVVKHTFRSIPEFQVLTKKPVCPAPEEIKINPRARSAKLRCAIKTL